MNNFENFVELENEIEKQISLKYPGLTEAQKSTIIVGIVIESGGWSEMVFKFNYWIKNTNSNMKTFVESLISLNFIIIKELLIKSGYYSDTKKAVING